MFLSIGGIVWWFGKSQVTEKATPTATSSSKATAAPAPLIDATREESTGIAPSPRHATGEIERHQQSRAGLVELEKAVDQQQEKVEERRKLLAALSRTKGIIYKGTDSKFDPPDENSENQKADDGVQTLSQIATLLKYPDEQLLPYAAGLDISDNRIKDLYPQLPATRRDLEQLRAAGSGADASSIAALDSRFDAIQSQLHAELVGVRKKLVEIHQTTQAEAVQRGKDAQDYIEAKREFETDQALLDAMNAKLAAEKERVKNSER
ncbi:hypothetical protein GCM10023212_05750 [Luteolibacter yonseiensis]